MTEQSEILKLAREMALATKEHGAVRERAFRNGAYDNGTDVTQHIPAAEAELIRRRAENTETE